MAEQQQPQRPPADARAAAVAAALQAAATAGGVGAVGGALAGYYAAHAALLAALTRLWLRWGYSRRTVRHGLRLTLSVTARLTPAPDGEDPRTTTGPALDAAHRSEAAFAAWFLERSTARVQAKLDADPDADPAAVERAEDRFLDQHLTAQDRRDAAAREVDEQASKPSQTRDGDRVILLWRAHPDDKVTPECRAADGCWFYADTPPVIGYPGMPHGGTCRCWPTKAPALDVVARLRTVNEAVRETLAAEPEHRPHPESTDERKTA